MNGVNKVIIVGTLGQDPEVKYMPNGNAVANLSVATNEKWKDQQGQPQERTEWHRMTIYGKLAEIVGEYLRKGSQAYFEGKLQTRKWQDQSGQDRYTTEIVVSNMQMIGGRQDGQRPAQHPQQVQQSQQRPASQQRPQPQQQPQQKYQAPQQQTYTPDLDDGWDRDIPY